MAQLINDVFSLIFQHVPQYTKYHTLRLVCKTWNCFIHEKTTEYDFGDIETASVLNEFHVYNVLCSFPNLKTINFACLQKIEHWNTSGHIYKAAIQRIWQIIVTGKIPDSLTNAGYIPMPYVTSNGTLIRNTENLCGKLTHIIVTDFVLDRSLVDAMAIRSLHWIAGRTRYPKILPPKLEHLTVEGYSRLDTLSIPQSVSRFKAINCEMNCLILNTSLESVSIVNSSCNIFGVEMCTKLKSLHIVSSKKNVLDSFKHTLDVLPQLTTLSLSSIDVSVDKQNLVDILFPPSTTVTRLTLRSCKIDDTILNLLHQFPNLSELNLTGTKVPEHSLAMFASQHPNLRIIRDINKDQVDEWAAHDENKELSICEDCGLRVQSCCIEDHKEVCRGVLRYCPNRQHGCLAPPMKSRDIAMHLRECAAMVSCSTCFTFVPRASYYQHAEIHSRDILTHTGCTLRGLGCPRSWPSIHSRQHSNVCPYYQIFCYSCFKDVSCTDIYSHPCEKQKLRLIFAKE